LASKLEVSLGTLRNWERGRAKLHVKDNEVYVDCRVWTGYPGFIRNLFLIFTNIPVLCAITLPVAATIDAFFADAASFLYFEKWLSVRIILRRNPK
jgi:hypothetical protein